MDLRQKIARLAYEHPEHRDELLQLITASEDLTLMAEDLLVALKKEAGKVAPYVYGYVTALGGKHRPSVMLTVSMHPKSEWSNGILENSAYAKFSFHLDPGDTKGFSIEHISGHGLPWMRKTRFKDVKSAVAKFSRWLNQAESSLAKSASLDRQAVPSRNPSGYSIGDVTWLGEHLQSEWDVATPHSFDVAEEILQRMSKANYTPSRLPNGSMNSRAYQDVVSRFGLDLIRARRSKSASVEHAPTAYVSLKDSRIKFLFAWEYDPETGDAIRDVSRDAKFASHMARSIGDMIESYTRKQTLISVFTPKEDVLGMVVHGTFTGDPATLLDALKQGQRMKSIKKYLKR